MQQRAHQRRRRRVLVVVFLLASLLVGLLAAAPADAHGEDIVGQVDPADREVLTSTPGTIRIKVPGQDPVDVKLTTASGDVIAFTGQPVRVDGLVTVRPPTLEPGTYVLAWVDGGEKASSFSVGRPNAEIDGGSVAAGAGPIAIVAGLLALVGALVAAVLAGRRRGTARVALSLSAAGTALAAAGVLSPPTGLLGAVTFVALVAGIAGAGLGLVGTGSTTGLGIRAGGVALLVVPVAGAVWRIGVGSLTDWEGLLVVFAAVALVLLATPVLVIAAVALAAGRSHSARAVGVVCVVALLATLPALVGGRGVEIREIRDEVAEVETCLGNSNRLEIQRCLEGSFTAVVVTEGVNAALDRLGGLVATNNRARYFCHEASHAIGRASLRENAGIAEAFRDGYDVCDFGYYHGIVEAAAAGLDDEGFREIVSTLCTDFASAEELFFMQCTHGLGHAAARRTNNDMLRSLEFCAALDAVPGLEGERLAAARNGCGTGVTMEWFAVATASSNTGGLPVVAEPRDVCHQVPDEWADECYEYVGNTLDSSDPVRSLGDLAGWCEGTDRAAPCYKGLARAAAGVGIAARDAIGVCEKATDTAVRDDCVRFYIAFVATTIDYDVNAVDRICELLPAKDRDGPLSLCETVRQAVVDVLAGGDGKDRSGLG
jgi:hypothetical protein